MSGKISIVVKLFANDEEVTTLFEMDPETYVKGDHFYNKSFSIANPAEFTVFGKFRGISKKLANLEISLAGPRDAPSKIETIGQYRLYKLVDELCIFIWDNNRVCLEVDGIYPEPNIVETPGYKLALLDGESAIITQMTKFEIFGVDLLQGIVPLLTFDILSQAMYEFGIETPTTAYNLRKLFKCDVSLKRN
jgi:hypothetical protein